MLLEVNHSLPYSLLCNHTLFLIAGHTFSSMYNKLLTSRFYILVLALSLPFLSGCVGLGGGGSYNDHFLGSVSGGGNLWTRVEHGMKINKPMNARVKGQIAHFQANPRTLKKIQDNARVHLFDIVEEIERRNLPMELALVPAIESLYQAHVYSRSGAAGLWQFVRGTGRAYGLSQSELIDYRRDPDKSTGAALDYLEYLHRYFDGDWNLAIAAYNGGEGTIRRAMKKNAKQGKPTDFWSLKIRKETMDYVPRVYALALMIKNPERYNVSIEPIPNRRVIERIALNKSIDIKQAAHKAEIDSGSLTRLNSHFVKGITPSHSSTVLVPEHHVASFKSVLPDLEEKDWNKVVAEAKAKARPRIRYYKVRKGDSLYKISRKFGVSIASLKKQNRLRSNHLSIGKRLKVGKTTRRVASKSSSRKSTKRSSSGSYKVRKGDTLYGIARSHGISVKALQKHNGMGKSTKIKPGQRLKIPKSRKV